MHLYMRLVFGARRARAGEGFPLKGRVCTGCMDNRGAPEQNPIQRIPSKARRESVKTSRTLRGKRTVQTQQGEKKKKRRECARPGDASEKAREGRYARRDNCRVRARQTANCSCVLVFCFFFFFLPAVLTTKGCRVS